MSKQIAFADIVVVDEVNIGVVVKEWLPVMGPNAHRGRKFEVYVRMYREIREYYEDEIDRYLVRHKYLDGDEIEYQSNGVNGL